MKIELHRPAILSPINDYLLKFTLATAIWGTWKATEAQFLAVSSFELNKMLQTPKKCK